MDITLNLIIDRLSKNRVRSKDFLSIFVIAILSLSFALPIVSVSAPLTTVNIDDDDVQVGDVITVWGPGGQIISGAPVKGYWDYPKGPDAWLLDTTNGGPDGSYSFEITVPDTVTGFHYIWVEDTSIQRWVSSSVITVNSGSRDMMFSPTAGQVGTSVSIIGIGFQPGLFNATFGSIRVITNGVVPVSGKISDSFNVPTVDPGIYDVTIEDSASNELSRTFTVTIGPLTGVNVDDDVVQPGDIITVWGPAGQVVSGASILGYWDYMTGPSALLLNSTSGNPDGSYLFEITVPETEAGFHYIWINDTSRAYTWSSNAITVNVFMRDMILSPSSGQVGTEVSLTGIGFPNGEYSLSFGDLLSYFEGTVIDEAISDMFVVPNVSPGTYAVDVKDSKNYEVTCLFVVSPSFVIPEYPLGTISAIVIGLISILLVRKRQRISLRY
ncbi:MAG: hypothetical protein ACXABY_13890 [Candidatus Thorarchaeota archaeon]|jgi:hypothetical protein